MTTDKLLRLLAPEAINEACAIFLGEDDGMKFKKEVLGEAVKLIKALSEIGDKYEAPARLVMLTAVAPLATQVVEGLVAEEKYAGAHFGDLKAKLS